MGPRNICVKTADRRDTPKGGRISQARAIIFSLCHAVLPQGHGCGDHTAKRWDAATGRELLTLKGHTEIVNSVAFLPDGTKLAAGSGDKTVKLWHAATEQEVLARSK